jgi:archaellum component FlaC
MAKRTTARARNGRLEEAMALLLQNQAMFLGQLGQMQERFAHIDERFARIDERFARIDERFARIETELEAIKSILIRHEQILEALPEAVRQKIGFKRP